MNTLLPLVCFQAHTTDLLFLLESSKVHLNSFVKIGVYSSHARTSRVYCFVTCRARSLKFVMRALMSSTSEKVCRATVIQDEIRPTLEIPHTQLMLPPLENTKTSEALHLVSSFQPATIKPLQASLAQACRSAERSRCCSDCFELLLVRGQERRKFKDAEHTPLGRHHTASSKRASTFSSRFVRDWTVQRNNRSSEECSTSLVDGN